MEREITSRTTRWAKTGAWVIGGLVFLFTLYKAITSSFTHDESFSTLHFFPQGELDILLYRHPFTSVITNNHIFNTLMMKLSESVFGLSEWALRLPNVLALLLYLVFGYGLCRRLPKAWMHLAAFVILIANPYLLDFFALARGYGLSIGTMIASLYFLLTYLKMPGGRYLLGFHLFGILSVMSNFALLNFYVAALGCFYLYPFWRASDWPVKFIRNLRLHLWNFLALVVLTVLVYTPFKVILENNTVSFGGKEGFFANTVRSVVSCSFYEVELSIFWINALGALACICVLIPAGLILWKWIRRDTDFFKQHTTLAVTNTIAWLIPLMTFVQHYLFGQDYLAERFAIFLYPLFALNLIFANAWLWQKLKRPLPANLILGTYCFGCIFLTGINLNLDYFLNWKYDKDTKAVMILLQDHRPEDGSSRTFGIFHQLEPTMNLYRHWYEMYWMEELKREPPEGNDDFIFTRQGEIDALGITDPREVLFESPETGMVLLKK